MTFPADSHKIGIKEIFKYKLFRVEFKLDLLKKKKIEIFRQSVE